MDNCDKLLEALQDEFQANGVGAFLRKIKEEDQTLWDEIVLGVDALETSDE